MSIPHISGEISPVPQATETAQIFDFRTAQPISPQEARRYTGRDGLVHEQFPTIEEHTEVKFKGTKTDLNVAWPEDRQLAKGKRGVVIEPGWVAPDEYYRRFAHGITAATGRPVAWFEVPRHESPIQAVRPSHLISTIKMRSQVTLGVSQELERQHSDSPGGYDFLGHSFGGLVLSKFIERETDYVNTATLIAGAGLSEHSFVRMFGRAVLSSKAVLLSSGEGMSAHEQATLAVQALLHVLKNPLRTALEGYQAATGDAIQPITRAHERNIPIGAIWFTKDRMFPTREITPDVIAKFHEFFMLDGNHNAPKEQPTATTAGVVRMVELLQQHRL